MGSSLIPLMVDQPKFNTPVQNATAALNLKQLGQQTQIQQQVLQENALKVAEEQRNLNAQQALGTALAAHTTKNPDGSFDIDHDGVTFDLAQKGYGPEALKYNSDARAEMMNAATVLKTNLENRAAAAKQAGGLVDSVPALPTAPPPTTSPTLGEPVAATQPDPQAMAAYQTAIKNVITEGKSRGILDDQHVAWLANLAANPTPEGDAQLRQYAKMAQDHATQILDARDQVKDLADNKLKLAQAAEATATLQEKQRTMDGSMLATAFRAGPDNYQKALGSLPYDRAKPFVDAGVTNPDDIIKVAMKPVEIATAGHEAATAAETARHNTVQEATEKTKASIESGRLALEREKAGFEMSGGVSPQAQMIAQGKMDPQTTRRLLAKSPGLVGQILTIDPKFDQGNIDNRFQELQEFGNTSLSKAGGQSLALNTLIRHAELYQETAEALKNGTFRPGNAVYNSVATAFGSAPPTNADLVARFFAGETGKVATGGVPAEGEIRGVLQNLSSSNSPDQIAGAGKTLLQIAAGRAQPLIERAKKAKIDGIVDVLGPDAKSILAKRGFDPGTTKSVSSAPVSRKIGDSVTLKNGKTVTVTAVHPDGSFDAK